MSFGAVGDSVTHRVSDNPRGVVNYRLGYKDGALGDAGDFSFIVNVDEAHCGQSPLDSREMRYAKSQNGSMTTTNFRFGEDARGSAFSQKKPLCLIATLTNVYPSTILPVTIQFSVRNTRPCWLLECFLD